MSRWLDLALDALAQARAGGSSARPVDSVDSADRREDRPASRLSTLTALSTEPSLADFEERAAIIEFDGGIDREWAEALARLECSPPPPGVTRATWRKAIDRAARFCDRWGAIAAAEGWTAGELFGLNPAAPFGRLDMRGAAFIGLDLDVIDVTADAIVFQAANGAIQRLQRRPNLAAPVWEAVGE